MSSSSESATSNQKQPPTTSAPENNESPEARKMRLIKEEQEKMRTAPPLQLTPPVAQTAAALPNPNAIDPQQAFMAGYERSKVDHYLQGFMGACIILGGSYLGYRLVNWAWFSATTTKTATKGLTTGAGAVAVGL